MGSVVPKIQETAKLVEDISNSAKEQDIGLGQINTAMGQLEQVTQTNTSSSQEVASASEQLSSQAQKLSQLMSFFKIAQNDMFAIPSSDTNSKPQIANSNNNSLDLRQFDRY
jgi:methyl-accepting chemotaxis protein